MCIRDRYQNGADVGFNVAGSAGLGQIEAAVDSDRYAFGVDSDQAAPVSYTHLISFSVLLLNTYAYTKVDMKYGAVIDTFSYVFVMVLSYLILKEKFTKGQLIGNLIIITGVMVYTL